ncbi:hypothetical protein GCK72_014820 [Caenorhabditis remanei]|uniref:Uncharacterized protein n=1 Tax=Caenorhabditis remanei TaxID=31234 RepID=A0A6A5GVH1_CAERE|nr:hypothetical protein GCK72_014820 [Caenorhabditis remanei]KAF1758362.1 hypothetical protein GCK72_014820 [Caenorhabditis remanei]
MPILVVTTPVVDECIPPFIVLLRIGADEIGGLLLGSLGRLELLLAIAVEYAGGLDDTTEDLQHYEYDYFTNKQNKRSSGDNGITADVFVITEVVVVVADCGRRTDVEETPITGVFFTGELIYTNLKNRIKRTYGFELEEDRFPIDMRGAGAVEIGGGALGRRLFSVGNVLEFGIRAAGGAVGGRGVVTDLAPRLAITKDPTSGNQSSYLPQVYQLTF